MPLDHGYGVAIGTLQSFRREDPDDYGKYYHGFITLNVNGVPHECAIDVDTHNNQITVEHRVVSLSPTDIASLLAKPNGYHPLAATPASGAIDYIRSQFLLPWMMVGCIPSLILSILPFKFRVANNPKLWTQANGSATLDVLEGLLNDGANARLLVFGEPYHYGGSGLHNIHQNQGDPATTPPSGWWLENGIWQDGCTIIEKTDGRIIAFLNKFSSQAFQTGNDGHPLPP